MALDITQDMRRQWFWGIAQAVGGWWMLASEAKQAYEEEFGDIEDYVCDCNCECGVAEEDWDDHVCPIEHDCPEDPDKSKQNAYKHYVSSMQLASALCLACFVERLKLRRPPCAHFKH